MKTWQGSMIAALFALSATAHADGPPVSIQFSIGTPPPVYAAPPVYAPAPPSMIWMPALGVYVALGVEQPIFYLGGVYYYLYGGNWYSGPHYGGPWRRMARPPEHLRRFEARDWGRYQDEARRHADDARWRHFRAAPQPQWQRGPQRGPQGQPWQHEPNREQYREQHREPNRDQRGEPHRDQHGAPRDERGGH